MNTNLNVIETDPIIPNPPPVKLPAETHLITEVLPKPDAQSSNYLTISSSKNSQRVFNFVSRETRTVRISGMTINWDKTNDLLMSYNANEDIEFLEIYADTLNIGAALSFPQTHIKIYARNLAFVGKDSSLNTTPKFITIKPDLTVAGQPGIKGGCVELYINSFIADKENAVPFVMTGTAGQPGGDGKVDLVADIDMSGTSVSGFRAFESCSRFSQLGGPNVVYYHLYFDDPICPSGYEYEKKGDKRWPKDGANAQPAGKPGVGGTGGDLTSTLIDIEKNATIIGGKSGPTGAYTQGQRGGTPCPAYWQNYEKHNKNCGKPTEYTCDEDVHYSQAGAGANAPNADKPIGDTGAFKFIAGKEYLWLHPLSLETAIQYFSDMYLNGYYQETADGLNIYKTALDQYQNPPQEFAYKFQQAKSEIQIMLNRLYSNTDYFGNPAGWVPMLSFESNLLIYRNEVKDSIQTLYLAYRINSQAKKEEAAKYLLQNSVNQLKSDVQKAIQAYSEALNQIPQLNQDFSNVSTAITTYTEHLKEIEAKLLKEAEGNIQLQQTIKCTLRIFSGILQIIPVGQPELGTVGKGLDIISNIDTSKPLDTFGQLGTLFAKYAESNLGDNAKKTKDSIDSTDTKDQSKSGDSAKKIIDAAKNLEPGLKEITDAINNFSAPEDQVKAELERLEGQNVQYKEIKKNIEELNSQKTKLVKQLTSVLQLMNTSLNTLTSGLLQIDSMNSQLSVVFSALNHDAILYAKKMEQNAVTRLVKYQYYLVKSYQYRILKVCPGVDYQLKYVFDAFVKLLDPTTDGILTDAQFQTLMSVYQEPIKTMADSIITQYNSSGPQLTSNYIVPLSNEQIAELNEKNSLTINLMNMGFWDFSQQGLRILNFGAYEIDLDGDEDKIEANALTLSSDPAIINLMYLHSGFSTLQSNGMLFGFCPKKDDSVMRWGTVYNINKPVSQRITPIVPSPSAQSMLSVLIDPSMKNPDILTQYLPSAWADITITKKVLPEGAVVNLKKLNLSFDFDFFPVSDNEVTLFLKNDGNVSPEVSIDKQDLNERKDGRGSFVRLFGRGSTVTLTAPETIGVFRFSKWINQKGVVVSTSNSVQINLDSTTILETNYELLA